MILLLLLGAFAPRLWELSKDEINGDEAFTFSYISASYADIIRMTLESREPHPVGSYFIFKTLLPLFGRSEFALRFPSVWAGVLAVALTYRLGRELQAQARFPTSATIAGALVMAVAPFSLYHSREVRMYAFVVALTAGAACFALSAWRSSRARDLIGYGLTSFVALHTHYYAAAVLLALNLFWAFRLLDQVRRFGVRAVLHSPSVWRWGLAQLILLAAYAPWVWLAREALTQYEGTAERFELATASVRTLSVFVAGDRAHPETLAFALIGAGILVLGTIALVARRASHALGFLLLYFGLPIALAAVAALSRPIFRERYFIVSLTPFCLLAGSALTTALQPGTTNAIQARRALGIAACAALGWATYEANRAYFVEWSNSFPSWRLIAQIAEQHHKDVAPERMFVVNDFPEPALSYYYPGPARVIVLPTRPLDEQVAHMQVEKMVREEGIMRVVLTDSKAPEWDGDGISVRALNAHFAQLEVRPIDEWRVVRIYGRRTPEELRPFNVVYSQTVTLHAANAFINRNAGLLEVALQWTGDPSALRGSEKVFIHVGPIGRRDRTMRQNDPPFTPEDLTGKVRLFGINLAGLDPGEYEVRVGIYDPELPDMLRWRTQDGDDLCIVGTFHLP